MHCRYCFSDLWHHPTFIKCTSTACAKLDVSLCVQCFAAGTEDNVHKNSDPYKVLSNAVKVNEHLWPSHEEIILLDTFMDTMSWNRVAQKLGKSPEECERHYFKHYVMYPKIEGLQDVNKKAFRFDTRAIEDRAAIMDDTVDSEGIRYILHMFMIINNIIFKKYVKLLLTTFYFKENSTVNICFTIN